MFYFIYFNNRNIMKTCCKQSSFLDLPDPLQEALDLSAEY